MSATTNKAISKIATAYGDLLQDPRYSPDRKAKIEKLKRYAQSLRGYERELLKKYYSDLFKK